MFGVKIELLSLDGSRSVEIEAVVDTGATFTKVSRAVADDLGLVPQTRHRFRLGDNDVVTRDVGPLLIRFGGETVTILVAVGADGEIPVLGATALESLGLWVDPAGHALIPRDAYELGMAST